jgi:hypothetical protein
VRKAEQTLRAKQIIDVSGCFSIAYDFHFMTGTVSNSCNPCPVDASFLFDTFLPDDPY